MKKQHYNIYNMSSPIFTLTKRAGFTAANTFVHQTGVSISFVVNKEIQEYYDTRVQLRILVKKYDPFLRQVIKTEPQTVIYTNTATLTNGIITFGIQSENGAPIVETNTYNIQLDPINNKDETTGGGLGIPVLVVNGGTEQTSLTAGQVLVGDGTNPVDLSKAAPTGDFVGTSDIQTLTNKTLDDVTNDITSNALFFGANKVDTDVVIPTAGQLLSASGPNTMGFVDFDTVVSGGDGIDVTGNVVSADPKANGGLVIDTAQLAVDLSATAMTGVPDGFVTGNGSTLSAIKYNHVATTAPTASDDSSAGYAVGSRWIDTTNDLEYVCVDASVGAAVWVETTQQAAGGLIGGDGIDVTGNTISMDPLANGGLDFSAGQARVNLSGNAMTGIANGLLVGNAGTSIAGLKLNQTNVPPTVNNDGTESYTIGSRWFDIAADREFVALDVTPGAAVWRDCTQQLSELIGGDGIDISANIVSADLKVNGGLAIESGKIGIDFSQNNLTAVPDGLLVGNGGVQVTGFKLNTDTVPPTVTNDNSEGYSVGSRWFKLPANSTTDGEIKDMIIYNGELHVTGFFTQIGGVSCPTKVAKYNGTTWVPLGTLPILGSPYAFEVVGSDLYLAGAFIQIDGVTMTSRVAKWNGSAWSAFGTVVGTPFDVFAIHAVGTDLYIGGSVEIYKLVGSVWTVIGNTLTGAVTSIKSIGTDVYMSGCQSISAVSIPSRVAKWDGSVWSSVGAGTTNSSVLRLSVIGTDLYACGGFLTMSSVAANRIAKWDGAVWTPLGVGLNSNALSLTNDGTNLYVGGVFSTAGGNPTPSKIAKWDGATWSQVGAGTTTGTVNVLYFNGTTLYIGDPTVVSDVPVSSRITTYDGLTFSPLPPSIYAEYIALDVTTGSARWFETTVQESEPLTGGDGIQITGTTIDVDLKANGGLVIESTEIGVDLGATAMTNVPTGFVTGNGSSLSAIKYNYTAAVDPTPANDSSENYVVGSTWLNLTSGVEFQCVDASVGVAKWESNVSLETGGTTSGYENINALFNPDVRWQPDDILGATGAIIWDSSVGNGSVLAPQGINTSFSPNSLGGQTSVHINPSAGNDASNKFVLDLGATFNGTDDFSGVFVVQDLENFAPDVSRFITFLDSTPFVQSDFNQPSNIAALIPTASGNFLSYHNNFSMTHTTSTNASVTVGTPTVIAFRYTHSSTEWKIWINQASDMVQTTNIRDLGPLTIATIGLGFSNTGTLEQGRIRVSEILWWGSALTDLNIIDISDRLLKYYGVRPFAGSIDYSNRYVFHDGTRWKAKLKSEYAKTVAPTVNDDVDAGYEVGSVWVDIVANKTYICTSPTANAAIWVETSQNLGSLVAGNGIDITGTTIDVDLKANGGLDIQSTELALNLGHTNISNVPLGILVGNAGTSIAGFKLNQTSVDPTVNDDGLQSYTIGSRWYNTTTDREFVALDVTPAAAVWRDTTQQLSELVGGNGITYTPATKTIDLDLFTQGGLTTTGGQARVDFAQTDLQGLPGTYSWLHTSASSTAITGMKYAISVGGSPTVNSDNTQGYSIGSRWYDITNNREWVATKVTTGAAVWTETTKTRFFQLNDVYVPREDIAFLNQTATYSVPLRLNNNLLDKPILSSWNDGVVVPNATANVIVGNALVDGLSGIKVTSAAGAIYGIDATGPLPNINTNGFSAIFLVGDIPAPAVTRNILTVASSPANYFVAATNRLLIDIDASGALVLTREGSTPVSSAPGTLFASKWNVICVTYTYDGANSTFRAYVNNMTTEVCALGFAGLWGLTTPNVGFLGNHQNAIIHDACMFNSSIPLATRTNIGLNYQNRVNFIGPIPESQFRWNGVAMSRGQKIVYREGSNPGNADNHTLGFRRGDLVIRLDNSREFLCVHNSTVATWDRLD